MSIILETNHLRKIYGSKGHVYTAVEDISIKVSEGEFVGIMGPSGSGKTTLLNMAATIDQPTSGDIRIDGNDIGTMNEEQLSAFRRDKLGFIFQDYNLLDTLTVRENILLPLAIAKMDVEEMERRVAEIAELFGIRALLDKYPYHMSGGQKQRTAASRAMVSKPRLVLADEPTGALDSKASTDLLESLKRLNEMNRTTILMVTHDAFAASYCSRILFIKDGAMFNEMSKGKTPRQAFYKKVLDVLAVLGGGANDVV